MPRPSRAVWGRVASRVAQYALVLLVALSLNFAIPRLAPGTPIDYLVPSEQVATITPEQRERVLAQFGLEKPLADQYWRYLAGILQGNLGYSTQQSRPVVDMLLERLPWTLVLVGGAITLSLIVGAGAGFLSAARRGAERRSGGSPSSCSSTRCHRSGSECSCSYYSRDTCRSCRSSEPFR